MRFRAAMAAVLHLVVGAWHAIGLSLLRHRSSSHAHSAYRSLPEFPTVNAVAGLEPVRPELTGLRLRYPSGTPKPLLDLLIDLSYEWEPSDEHRRREVENRLVNWWLRRQRNDPTLPPILSYLQETDLVPVRLQPIFDRLGDPDGLTDLTDLEHRALRHAPLLIQPRLPQDESPIAGGFRPLLPRQYREFFRTSPYPRLAGGMAAISIAVIAALWITQTQHEEAVAAGQAHTARSALHAELAAAQSYGVDPRALRPLERRAQSLDTSPVPEEIVISRQRVSFFRDEATAYASLLGTLRRLEHRALRYWTGQEGAVYAGLLDAVDTANAAGMHLTHPAMPACGTPACFRGATRRQSSRAAWLRETAATLRVYAGQILGSSDPATRSQRRVNELHALAAILPRAAAPVPAAQIDGALATAGTVQAYARAGALAHLDVDALASRLVKHLPRRAVVVAAEEGKLWCYQRGRSVYETLVTTDASTPSGIFHIQAKQASIPATFWGPGGAWQAGSLADWMPITTSGIALQSAPWQLSFGPDSSGDTAAYAPSTPGSIDLSPGAAAFVYSWVSGGTEVVVY